MGPTSFDIWFNLHLSGLIGKSQPLDAAIVQGVEHYVLGGFCYGAVLFMQWVRANQPGGEQREEEILRIFFASLISIVVMLGIAALFSRTPPGSNPLLEGRYPPKIYTNTDTNCFPSFSTTLYSTLAAGIYPLDQATAWYLGIGVIFLVGLPRIYVGGHYPTDVMVGLALGLASHFLGRLCPQSDLRRLRERVFGGGKLAWIVGQVLIFAWLLQVFDEFREGKWLAYALARFIGG